MPENSAGVRGASRRLRGGNRQGPVLWKRATGRHAAHRQRRLLTADPSTGRAFVGPWRADRPARLPDSD